MSAETTPPGNDELAGVYRRPDFPAGCQGIGEGACKLAGCPGRQMEMISADRPPSTTPLREGEGYCPTYQLMTSQGLVYPRAKPVDWSDRPVAPARPKPHASTTVRSPRRIVDGPSI